MPKPNGLRLRALIIAAALGALLALAPPAMAGEVAGDFNGDGNEDLAIGVPGEDVAKGDVNVPDAGAVSVLYARADGDGLTASSKDDQRWTQDSQGIGDDVEKGDQFGRVLAAADFNGDGRDDLAIGVPLEDVSTTNSNGQAVTRTNGGVVHVLYGSSTGLVAGGSQVLHQDLPGIQETVEGSDEFGAALAAGRFNAEEFRHQLAIGVPGESTTPGVKQHGAVAVLRSSGAQLGAEGNQLWTQGAGGLAETPEDFDRFGWSLAADDLGGDGPEDLAVGVPWENLSSPNAVPDGGLVHVLYGKVFEGLSGEQSQVLSQDSSGVEDQAEVTDVFGYTLATGNFDANLQSQAADLVVGAPFEDVLDVGDSAGGVSVIYSGGPTRRLIPKGDPESQVPQDQFFTQEKPGIPGVADTADNFGRSIAAGSLDGDVDRDDLAIGAPEDQVGDAIRPGTVTLIFGSPTGLKPAAATGHPAARLIHQDVDGVEGVNEHDDGIGSSVAVANIGNVSTDWLAVGAVEEDIGSAVDAGAVNLLSGQELGETGPFDIDQIWHQNSNGVNDAAETDDHFGFLGEPAVFD